MNGKLKQSVENVYKNGFLFAPSIKWQTNCHNRKWSIYEYWLNEVSRATIFSKKFWTLYNLACKHSNSIYAYYFLNIHQHDKLDSHESSFIVLMIARGHTMYDIMKVI